MVLGERLRKGVFSLQTAIQTPKGNKKETIEYVDDDLSSVLLGEQDDFQTQSYTSKSTYGSIYNNRSIRERKGTNDALGTPQFVKEWTGGTDDEEDENSDIWGVSHEQRTLSEFEALSSLGASKHKSAREHNINSSPPYLFANQQLKNTRFTPHYTTPSFELPAELRRPSVSSRSRQRGDTISESGSVMSNHSSSTITTKQGFPVVPSSPRAPAIPTTPGRSTYLNTRTPPPSQNQLLRTPGRRQQPAPNLFDTPSQSGLTPSAYPTPSRTSNTFLALVDHGDWGDLANQSAQIQYAKSPDRKPRHLDAIRQLRLSRVDDSDDSSSDRDDGKNNLFDAFDDDEHESDPLIEFSDEESIASLAVTAEDKPDVITRKVSRMTSGQLRRWDGFESQVTMLVKEIMPQHVKEVPKLMHKFAGREAELMQTLRGMAKRSPRQRWRANIPKSKGIKGCRRVYAVQMDAVAIIAAACTLDDQLQAVKPEFVVDEGHPGRNHDGDDSTESDDESQYYDSEDSSTSEEEEEESSSDDDEDEGDSTIYSEDEDSSEDSSYDNVDGEVETTADTFWNGYR